MGNVKLYVFIGMLALVLAPLANADWKVDFSRRSTDIKKQEYAVPENSEMKKSIFDYVTSPESPVQEVVIINTGRGFVPASLHVRVGRSYKINVVNINEKEKNVSFVLDAFSEHHATYFGQLKSFLIQPKKEGVFTFQSPETSAQGRLVVLPAPAAEVRTPAGE